MNHKKVQVHLWREINPGGRVYALFHRTPAKGDYWQPITGNLDLGESLEACALREASEEAGVRATQSDLSPCLWSFVFSKEGRNFSENIFGLHSQSGDLQISGEHRAYEWVSYSAARERMHFECNRRGLDLVEDWLNRKER